MKAQTGIFLAALIAAAPTAVRTADTVEIPSVTGMSRPEATSTLQRAGFRVHAGWGDSCAFPKGVISRQQPEGGTEAKPGAFVIILENRGGGFKMPNLLGRSYEDAAEQARQLGMAVSLDQSRVRTRDDIPGVCENPREDWSNIESQQPAPGTDVCVASPGTVSLSRTKLKQKLLTGRRCEPLDPCVRHPKFCVYSKGRSRE